jgi:hypothetical protein
MVSRQAVLSRDAMAMLDHFQGFVVEFQEK